MTKLYLVICRAIYKDYQVKWWEIFESRHDAEVYEKEYYGAEEEELHKKNVRILEFLQDE
jgi:hypothetical protein